MNQNLSKLTRVTRLIQGHETNLFKSNFEWSTALAAPVIEEGRGRVAGTSILYLKCY